MESFPLQKVLAPTGANTWETRGVYECQQWSIGLFLLLGHYGVVRAKKDILF